MRNIYVIISVLLFSLAACQEKEILGYSIERDGLQFDYDTNEMRVTVEFSFSAKNLRYTILTCNNIPHPGLRNTIPYQFYTPA